MNTDTIAAIATGVGTGGISIIRISGNDALPVIDKIYRSKKNRQKLVRSKEVTQYITDL